MLNKEQTLWVAGQNIETTPNFATDARTPMLLQLQETKPQSPTEPSTQSGCLDEGHTVCPEKESTISLEVTVSVSSYRA
jgi:hypothetical protein